MLNLQTFYFSLNILMQPVGCVVYISVASNFTYVVAKSEVALGALEYT